MKYIKFVILMLVFVIDLAAIYVIHSRFLKIST